MKKLLTVIIAMGFLFTTYAQKVDSLPDTTKLTLGKFYSDVKAGINGLAQSLKVPATHVYTIMIKQQTTQAISNLIFLLVFIILSFVFYFVAIKTYKLYNVRKDENLLDITVLSFIILAITVLITVVCFWSDYASIVTGFVNPEYGAIKEIISFVK